MIISLWCNLITLKISVTIIVANFRDKHVNFKGSITIFSVHPVYQYVKFALYISAVHQNTRCLPSVSGESKKSCVRLYILNSYQIYNPTKKERFYVHYASLLIHFESLLYNTHLCIKSLRTSSTIFGYRNEHRHRYTRLSIQMRMELDFKQNQYDA